MRPTLRMCLPGTALAIRRGSVAGSHAAIAVGTTMQGEPPMLREAGGDLVMPTAMSVATIADRRRN